MDRSAAQRGNLLTSVDRSSAQRGNLLTSVPRPRPRGRGRGRGDPHVLVTLCPMMTQVLAASYSGVICFPTSHTQSKMLIRASAYLHVLPLLELLMWAQFVCCTSETNEHGTMTNSNMIVRARCRPPNDEQPFCKWPKMHTSRCNHFRTRQAFQDGVLSSASGSKC